MPRVFAYQFRDYAWGAPRNVIKEELTKDGKEITEENSAMYYYEKIFGVNCQIAFLFTLSSQLLCGVTLIWNNTDIGVKLKEELTKKYGEPAKLNPYIEEYTWTDTNEAESDDLTLDYNYGDTRLEYYGGDYFKQYQKELTNLFTVKSGYKDKPVRQPHIIMELDGGRDHYYRK
jgi:hypothetical protein